MLHGARQGSTVFPPPPLPLPIKVQVLGEHVCRAEQEHWGLHLYYSLISALYRPGSADGAPMASERPVGQREGTRALIVHGLARSQPAFAMMTTIPPGAVS